MLKKLYILSLILPITVLMGCESNFDDSSIDYRSLDKLEIILVEEIGNNDEHLFGRLRDLVVMDNGTFFVSDWGSVTIQQFDKDGNYERTIADEGGGPGELSSFFLLFEGGDDTLIVRHRGMRQHIDYFTDENGAGEYSHSESISFEAPGDRFVTLLGKFSEFEFFALAPHNSNDLMEARKNQSGFSYVPIALVDRYEKIIQDSLHVLKRPTVVAEYGERSMMVIGMPPYQMDDRFQVIDDDRYLIARPDSASITIYDKSHTIDSILNLEIKKRPVGDDEVSTFLENIPQDYHGIMSERIPDFKPPFLNVWATGDSIFLHMDSSSEGKELMVLTLEGEPVGRISLSEFDEIKVIKENRIYALHKDPDKAESIRIYELI